MKKCLFCEKDLTLLSQIKFCNHSCSASFNNKRRKSRSEESRNKTSISSKNQSEESKNKRRKKLQLRWDCTKEERESKRKRCSICNKVIGKTNKNSLCREHWFESEEYQKVLGNYTKYKKGYVFNKYTGKEVYLLSGLEFKYYVFLEKNNIKWIKPKPILYLKEGKERKYFCDFYLVDY